MAKDKSALTVRRRAVLSVHDVDVRTTDANSNRLDQYGSVSEVWLGKVFDARRCSYFRLDS